MYGRIARDAAAECAPNDGRIRCLCYDGFSGVDCAVSSFSAALLRPFSALQVGTREYPEHPCVGVSTHSTLNAAAHAGGCACMSTRSAPVWEYSQTYTVSEDFAVQAGGTPFVFATNGWLTRGVVAGQIKCLFGELEGAVEYDGKDKKVH